MKCLETKVFQELEIGEDFFCRNPERTYRKVGEFILRCNENMGYFEDDLEERSLTVFTLENIE